MKHRSLFLILYLLTIISCNKVIDTEKNTWDINLKTANRLASEYPNFDRVINEQLKSAEIVMDDAKKIADKKAKGKRMAEANAILKCFFIRNLEELGPLMESIQTKSAELRGMKLPADKITGANHALSAGEKAVSDAKRKIIKSIEGRAEADNLTGQAVSALRLAESDISEIILAVKNRQQQEKKAGITSDAQKTSELKTEGEAQVIKCSYCGTLNSAGLFTCKGCGAPLVKK